MLAHSFLDIRGSQSVVFSLYQWTLVSTALCVKVGSVSKVSKLNGSVGFVSCCLVTRVFGNVLFWFRLFHRDIHPEPDCKTINAVQWCNVSWRRSAAEPLTSISSPHRHHVFRWQSSPAARQDSLLEQVYRVFPEQRAVAGVPVLCPQRGVLQNLQGLIVLLLRLCWSIRGHHRGQDPHLRLRKSAPNATHEEIMQVQHWTKERCMHPDYRGWVPQWPGPLGEND